MSNHKAGANTTDQNHIRRMAAEGANAKEIADVLRLPVECVESFMPEQPKPKRKPVSKAAPAED